MSRAFELKSTSDGLVSVFYPPAPARRWNGRRKPKDERRIMQHFTTDVAARRIPPRRAQRENFVTDINRYLSGTGMAEATFGRRAVNDPAFVMRARQHGYRPHEETLRRVYDFMAETIDA